MIQLDALAHIPEILHRLRQRPLHKHAFNYYKEGSWTHFSTEQFLDNVQFLALSLRELGLKKGDRVGILAKSSPYWAIADFAIALAGGVTVPFFSNLSSKHFLFEVEQSEPKFIFVGDLADWKFVKTYRSKFQQLISLEIERGEADCMLLNDLLKWGDAIFQKDPQAIFKLEQEIDENDLVTIIYSSGSTGRPKGVELTHKNLVSIIHYEDFLLTANDKYLSILPLAHIFSKQIYLIMIAWGVPIYFLNDFSKIGEVCQSIPITRMITVPRVLEKVYAKIIDHIQGASFLKKMIGSWAIHRAHKEEEVNKNMLFRIADRLVYSKIRKAFGKHFHSIISGGAALNPHMHKFFLNVGIPIYQGWGLTEGSTIAVNRFSQNKIGTVGPPIPSISFKISDQGEVLAKGPTVMRGYHKNPEATKRAIDTEGWLHTGDLGFLDEDGHLVIKGRMNESFKTSKGEFVAPVPIEQKISESPLIDTAMVFGEAKPFASVFLFPDTEAVTRAQQEQGLSHLGLLEYLSSPAVVQEVERIIDEVNETLDRWQKIKAYRFILDPPSIEGGVLTPTLKLRRAKVLEKYSDLVSEIYSA